MEEQEILQETLNIKELIRETVEVGSVQLALDKELFTSKDLLEFLLTREANDRDLIAYEQFIRYVHYEMDKINSFTLSKSPLVKYIGKYYIDNVHFLKKALDTIGDGARSYILLHRMLSYKYENNLLINCKDPDQGRLGGFIESIVCACTKDLYEKIKIICNTRSIISHHINAGRISCFRVPSIYEMTYEHYVNCLIDNDAIEFIQNVSPSLVVIKSISRCYNLSKSSPLYWKKIKGIYENVISDIFESGIPERITQKHLVDLRNIFPDFIPENIYEFSTVSFEICKLKDHEVKAYYLGFPIHYHMPTDEEISKALKHLDSVGIETYCKEVRKDNLKYSLRPYIRNSIRFNKKPDRLNMHDVMQEDPYNYSPLDIFEYIDNSRMTVFTRPSFPTIVNSGINHWTTLKLPISAIVSISSRIELATKLKLPDAKPLEDLLNDIVERNERLDSIDYSLIFSSASGEQILPRAENDLTGNINPITSSDDLTDDGIIDIVQLMIDIDHQIIEHQIIDDQDIRFRIYSIIMGYDNITSLPQILNQDRRQTVHQAIGRYPRNPSRVRSPSFAISPTENDNGYIQHFIHQTILRSILSDEAGNRDQEEDDSSSGSVD